MQLETNENQSATQDQQDLIQYISDSNPLGKTMPVSLK